MSQSSFLSRINPVALLVFAVAAVVLLWLYSQLEEYETTVYTGLKGEARTNPLYAHRLFLKRMGISAMTLESVDQIREMPSLDSVIVIDTYRQTMSDELLDRVLEWVERGGHLVTAANVRQPHELDDEDGHNDPVADEKEDYLQSVLGIRIGKHVELSQNGSGLSDDENAYEAFEIALPETSKLLEISVDMFHDLLLSVDKKNRFYQQEVTLEGNSFLVRSRYGNGLISVVSDLNFLEWKRIGYADNAEFFWHLVHANRLNLDEAWLISNDDMPPLWKWLWIQAKWLVISSLIFIFFSLFYLLGNRLGPLLAIPPLERRRLLEHISASAYHFWQTDKGVLVEASRDALHKQINRKYLQWQYFNKAERIRYLSEHIDASEKEIQSWLYGKPPVTQDEFVFLVKKLEEVRRQFL